MRALAIGLRWSPLVSRCSDRLSVSNVTLCLSQLDAKTETREEKDSSAYCLFWYFKADSAVSNFLRTFPDAWYSDFALRSVERFQIDGMFKRIVPSCVGERSRT